MHLQLDAYWGNEDLALLWVIINKWKQPLYILLLKLNMPKTKIMPSGPITSGK